MKFLVFIISAVVLFSTAHARKVCGVEIGEKRIGIMAEVCKPLTVAAFRSLYSSPSYTKQCVVEGKTVVVGVMINAGLVNAFDFTTKSTWKTCGGKVVPVSLDDQYLQETEFGTVEI